MSVENKHYSSTARKDEFQSRIAKDLHPYGSHTVEVEKKEEDFESVQIPEHLLRLSRLNDNNLSDQGINPGALDSWLMALANYQIPPGFSTLEKFMNYINNLAPVKKEKEYYQIVSERKKRK